MVLLAKHMKGAIKVYLPRRNFHYGEDIAWTFTLHAKKEIVGQDLLVHLIGYKKERTYSKWKRTTRNVEFTRFTTHIESWVRYESGLKRDYDFQIQIPSQKDIFGGETLPDLWNSVFGKLARYSLKHMRHTNYTWQLRVDLEADGLDISGKRDVFVTNSV